MKGSLVKGNKFLEKPISLILFHDWLFFAIPIFWPMRVEYLVRWQLLTNQVRICRVITVYPGIQARAWVYLVGIPTWCQYAGHYSCQFMTQMVRQLSQSLELVRLLVYQFYIWDCLLVMCILFRYRNFTLVNCTVDMGPIFAEMATHSRSFFKSMEAFTDKVMRA